jgi:hypothetical protein
MTLAATSFLIGIFLSQKFGVLSLFPPMVLILILALGAATLGFSSWWNSCVTTLVDILGLQFGYLIGLGILAAVTSSTFARPSGAARSPSLGSHHE